MRSGGLSGGVRRAGHQDTHLAAIIGALPKVSIDHLGLSKIGLPDLLRLAGRGVYVKAAARGAWRRREVVKAEACGLSRRLSVKR